MKKREMKNAKLNKHGYYSQYDDEGIWKAKFNELPLYPNFVISKNGTVAIINDLDDGRDDLIPIKPTKNKKGELEINIFDKDAKDVTILLAKLMLNTYIGDLDLPIKYNNKNKSDCAFENLSYDVSGLNIQIEENSIYIDHDEYKRIISFDNITKQDRYYVNKHGIIYDAYKKNFMPLQLVMNYPRGSFLLKVYNLMKRKYETQNKLEYVHRVTFETWNNRPIPSHLEIDHKDGNKHHNYIGNFDLVSSRENAYRAIDLDLKSTKFKRSDIHYFAQCISQNMNVLKVIKNLQLTDENEIASLKRIYRSLINRNIYKDILKDYDINNYDRSQDGYVREDMFTLEEAEKYCKLMSEGKTYPEIMDLMNIPAKDRVSMRARLYKLRSGQTYPQISKKYNYEDFINNYRLPDNKVSQIKAVLENNSKSENPLQLTDIARHFGISKAVLNLIKNESSYKNVKADKEINAENQNIEDTRKTSVMSDLVRKCCEYMEQNKSIAQLASDLGLNESESKDLIVLGNRIRNRGEYSYISKNYKIENYDSDYHRVHHQRKDGYTPDEVRLMCEIMQNGGVLEDVRKALNITSDSNKYLSIKTTLYNIRKGKNYPEIAKDYDFSNYNGRSKKK